MLVRDAVPADLPTVKAIYDAQVAGGIATFDTAAPPLSYWQERLASPHHLLVADQDRDPAGQASVELGDRHGPPHRRACRRL